MSKLYDIKIILNDDLGEINLVLDEEVAPNTVNHFMKLVDQNFFDNTIFHRVIDNFMIQGGGYKIKDNTLVEVGEVAPIKGEFLSNGFNNPLKHELGVISMARTMNKDSATSQFFICSATCSWLDNEYAAFGYAKDEKSKEIIKKLAATKTGNLNQYFQDFPLEVISIKTIKKIDEKDK